MSEGDKIEIIAVTILFSLVFIAGVAGLVGADRWMAAFFGVTP